MLNVQCQEHYDKVVAFAKTHNKWSSDDTEGLEWNLKYLDEFAGKDNTRCDLSKDFAPMSFGFSMYKKDASGEYKYWFTGGLIFHGKVDDFGSGAAPTFAVTLTPTNGWSIHT